MKLTSTILIFGTLFVFTACDNNNNVPENTVQTQSNIPNLVDNTTDNDTNTTEETPVLTYEVTVTNLSVAQPLAPIVVTSKSLYTVGEAASVALEHLAEEGDNTMLLDETSVSGTGMILPSKSETLTFKTSTQNLSLAGMLVNTNDGFVGLNNYDLSALQKDQSIVLSLNVYDAGTEENDELATNIPGQNGAGFNVARESRNSVAHHNGVLTKDDGLPSSGLNESHRFQNPFATVQITRK